VDRDRFDDLTRAMAGGVSRRRAVRTLFAGALGSVAALGGSRAMAAPGSKGHVKADCCPADHPNLCNLTCVDLSSDPRNCGTCGTACMSGVCTNGVCQQPPPTFCTPGESTGQPCSAGIGACQRAGTMVCSADGSAYVCSAVAGTPQQEMCNGIDDDCDGVVDNGAICPPVPNATSVCAGGRCQYACNQGFADCDGNPANGCEQMVSSDPLNCGGCGVVCPGATPTCLNGVCVA
jgi:hypothetical protein